MIELKKRWKFEYGMWWLEARGTYNENRAFIDGPTRAGYYHLHLWNDTPLIDWEKLTKSKDLKALKTIGRIAAAGRLHV